MPADSTRARTHPGRNQGISLIGAQWSALVVVGAVCAVLLAAPFRPGPTSRLVASNSLVVPATPSAAALWVDTRSGVVIGRATAGAAVHVEVSSGTTADVVADGTGAYQAAVGRSNGRTGGLHTGDVVTVTDRSNGAVRQQQVSLTGVFDEVTGELRGTTVPNSTVALDLYTNGDRATFVRSAVVRADSSGLFTYAAGKVSRGYQFDVRSSDVSGQVEARTLQTPNATVVSTSRHLSLSQVQAGTAARFTLTRSGAVVGDVSSVADSDGVAQAAAPAAVLPGDVLRVAFDVWSGASRSITLEPFDLDAVADPAANVVRGRTAPDARVVVIQRSTSGDVMIHARAGADGQWSAAVAPLSGGELLSVWRVADPERTGIGIQQIDVHSPVLWVEDATGRVRGYGRHGAGPARVELRRAGVVVATARGQRPENGSLDLRLGQAVQPGDDVAVVTGDQSLPVFRAPAQRVALTSRAPAPSGSATPGYRIEVRSTATCLLSTDVGADGTWSGSLPCAAATAPLEVRQVQASGPANGSFTYGVFG